jgi:UDP-N-acetylmuramoyl-tripeptide--D-alanyl-D-alanine ligase
MIPMTLAEIAAAVGGSASDGGADVLVAAEAFVDSRSPVAGGLFVAVAGERVDGNDFAADAVRNGAAGALVRRAVDVPHVLVDDPVQAVGRLAAHVRAELPELVVVGITGSQGKTSAKDILAQALERAGRTVSPPGSLNNEIGVPLTLTRATPDTDYLVAEMGARGRGHIAYLTSMTQPSVGVVLNVGVAHVGEFGSKEEIAIAKGELVEALPVSGTAVLNRDDPLVDAMRDRTSARTLTFGYAADADVRILRAVLADDGTVALTLAAQSRTYDLALPLVGVHQAMNAAAAAAAAMACGLAADDVVEAIAAATLRSHWRMETTRTASGVTIVNDAYNANPDSMRVALETVAALGRRSGGRTIAVLGEMRELGDTATEAHRTVGRLAADLGFDLVVVVGDDAQPIGEGAATTSGWAGATVSAADADAALSALDGALRSGDVVLVKASRAVGLERVGEALARRPEGDR